MYININWLYLQSLTNHLKIWRHFRVYFLNDLDAYEIDSIFSIIYVSRPRIKEIGSVYSEEVQQIHSRKAARAETLLQGYFIQQELMGTEVCQNCTSFQSLSSWIRSLRL